MAFNKPYIICSALWIQDNQEHVHQPSNVSKGYVVAGRRHHNCFRTCESLAGHRTIKNRVINKEINWEQGFITSDDRFVDRNEGRDIAFKAGQVDNPDGALFSEDLY